MKVWIVVTGAPETLPLGWNADELTIVKVFDNEAAANAHAAQLNALTPPKWEIASVEAWDVLS